MAYLHVSDNRDDFYDWEEEFRFAITFDTKQVDADCHHKEDRDENGVVMLSMVPKIDGNWGRDDLQWKNREPLHGIIPPHSESPCRI